MASPIFNIPWSAGLLSDWVIPDIRSMYVGEPEPARFAPLLRVDSEGAPWLAGGHNEIVRGGTSWVRQHALEALPWRDFVPLTEGEVVLLQDPAMFNEHSADFESIERVDAKGRSRWRVTLPRIAKPDGFRVLRWDEETRPYLLTHFYGTSKSLLHHIDPETGSLTELDRLFAAPDLHVWAGATWQILFLDGRRCWVRRAFGGNNEVVSDHEILQPLMTSSIAVRPDGGPVLVCDGQIVSVSPDGQIITMPIPRILEENGPGEIDIRHVCSRLDGRLWAAACDAVGFAIHEFNMLLHQP